MLAYSKVINMFTTLINFELDKFYRYAEELETFLSEKANSIETEFKEKTKHLTSKESEILFEHLYEENYHNFSNSFPNILRRSLFLSCYSFLETELDKLCKSFEIISSTNIKRTDLKHGGIHRSEFYLKKVVTIPFPDKSSYWSKIKELSKVRNYFAHDNSCDIEKKNPIYNTIKQLDMKGLQLISHYDETRKLFNDNPEYYTINISDTFCFEFIDILSAFFSELLELNNKETVKFEG